jgi:hypothetical protein
MTRNRSPRRGVAIMWAMVIVTVLAMIAATAVWQCMAGRSGIDLRQNHLRALWLARSGAEFAADRLRDNPDYAGETIVLAPDTDCQITVSKDADTTGAYQVRCVARSPAGGPASVRKSLTWKATRTADGAEVILDSTAADHKTP